MKWEEYIKLFENILSSKSKPTPYNDAHYLNYAKLNITRIKRWVKKGTILPENIAKLKAIEKPLNWILITEPWCGDASQISPFIYLLSETNSNFNLQIILRDSEKSEINNYLTNGNKAIPKLIIRNENGNDLFVWGPRTVNCHNYFLQLKESGIPESEQKAKLQEWYNQDAGISFQNEFIQEMIYHLTTVPTI